MINERNGSIIIIMISLKDEYHWSRCLVFLPASGRVQFGPYVHRTIFASDVAAATVAAVEQKHANGGHKSANIFTCTNHVSST